jgi:hypothetical protein
MGVAKGISHDLEGVAMPGLDGFLHDGMMPRQSRAALDVGE